LQLEASEVQVPVSMTGTSAPPLESPMPPLDDPELPPELPPLLLLAVESLPPPSWLLGPGLLPLSLLLQP
jgi:hypothetical protein